MQGLFILLMAPLTPFPTGFCQYPKGVAQAFPSLVPRMAFEEGEENKTLNNQDIGKTSVEERYLCPHYSLSHTQENRTMMLAN